MKARVRTGWDKLRLEWSIAWDEWKARPNGKKIISIVLIFEVIAIGIVALFFAHMGADLYSHAELSDGEKGLSLMLAAIALCWVITRIPWKYKKEN